MSWFDRTRAAAIPLMAFGLSGCFTPLYSESAHPGLVADLQSVEVEPIKDRIGHYLGDDLISKLNGTGSTPKAKYRLEITVAVNSQTPTIASQINAANADTMIGKAHYKLIKIEDASVVDESDALAFAVYDRTLDSFANLRAGRDAEIRIARELADELELRVAVAIGAPPPTPVPSPDVAPTPAPAGAASPPKS